MNRKLALILVSLSLILSPIYIYSSIIYTQKNVKTFSPDIAVVLGSGTAGTSEISVNGTSANVSVSAARSTCDFVDNNASDVDSYEEGTHSNFTAQQYGPDSINDILTESAAGTTEVTITASWGADVGNDGAKYPNDGSDYVGYSGTRPYRTGNRFPLTNLPSGATVTKVEVIFSVSQIGGADHLLDIQPYNGDGQADPETDSGLNMYTRCGAGTEYVNDDTSCRTTGVKTIDLGSQACTDVMNAKSAVNRFTLGWHEEGDNSAEARLDEYTDATDPPKLRITFASDYQLDLEVQWTSADYDETNGELGIYGGTMDAEDIRVDVWNGSDWENLFTDLSPGWNNVSVSSYLTSSNFTIRFKGGTETGDATQSSWNIDATLLHVYTGYDFVDYVDNNTWDEDSSADKGTHSNFTAQQSGPDSINDTLTEEDTGGTAYGFVWLDTPDEVDLGSTYSSWVENQDLSDDSVPSTATGVILAWVADTTSDYHSVARGSEDTTNYMSSSSYCEFEDETWRMQIVKLGSNKYIDTWRDSSTQRLYVMGYTVGTDPEYRTVPAYIDPTTTGWGTYTAPDLDADTDGIILFVRTRYSSDSDVEVRAVGSSNTQSSLEWEEYNTGLWVVKVDANDQFQADFEQPTYGDMYLIAETKGSIEYWINYVSIPDPSTGSWQDRDLDNYITVPSDSTGAFFRVIDTSTRFDYRAGVRKNGISWAPPRFDCGEDQQLILGTGIDASNIYEAYYESTSIGMYLEAVTRYVDPTNYELDLEVQWTDVDHNEINAKLCIYGGAMDSENIRVDVWNGTAWQNVITDLASGWNNASVSSYLTSSNFSIRFNGGTEASDGTQSSWNIDVTLLHIWTATYDYILSATSQKAYDQNIRLTLYDYNNTDRLSNCTIWFRDGTTSVQINITNGVVEQDVGPWYLLPTSETRYIVVHVEESDSGTSVLSIKLEAVKGSSIVYTCLIELTVN